MVYPDSVESARPASLFPVLKASEQEMRATSILLSVLRLVPAFSESMLKVMGAPAGRRSKLSCYTEIVPSKQLENDGSKSRRAKSVNAGLLRPDGLIICASQSKNWSAYVEAKIAGNPLDEDQVKSYLRLAALNGVNAVITISTELTIHPTQSPVVKDKDIPKGVSLFHFSWLSLVTLAATLNNSREVSDLEQRIVLQELRTFITHPESKLTGTLTLSSAWPDLIRSFHDQLSIPASNPLISDVSEDWMELERYIELSLCSFLGDTVRIVRPKKFQNSREEYGLDIGKGLASSKQLRLKIDIPNAAANITVSVDLHSKSVLLGMNVQVKQDCRPKTSVTWLVSQLNKLSVPHGLFLKGSTPRYRNTSDAKFSEVVINPDLLLSDRKINPRSIEIVYSLPQSAKNITKPKVFAEFLRLQLEEFYKNIAQHVEKYNPPPPRPLEDLSSDVSDADESIAKVRAPEQRLSAVEDSRVLESLPAVNNWKDKLGWSS